MSGHTLASRNGVEQYRSFGGAGRGHVSSQGQVTFQPSTNKAGHRHSSQSIRGSPKQPKWTKDTYFKADPKLKNVSQAYGIPLDQIHRSPSTPKHSPPSFKRHNSTTSKSEISPLHNGDLDTKYVDLGRKSDHNSGSRKQTRNVTVSSSGNSKQGKWDKTMIPQTAQKSDSLPEIQNTQTQLTSSKSKAKPCYVTQRDSKIGGRGQYTTINNNIRSHSQVVNEDRSPVLQTTPQNGKPVSSRDSPRHTQRTYDPKTSIHSGTRQDMDIQIKYDAGGSTLMESPRRAKVLHQAAHHSNSEQQTKKIPPEQNATTPSKNNIDGIKIMLNDNKKQIGPQGIHVPSNKRRVSHQAAHTSNSLPLQSQTAEQFALPSHQAAHPSNSLFLPSHQAAHTSNSLPLQSQIAEQFALPSHQAAHPSNSLFLPSHQAAHTSNSLPLQNQTSEQLTLPLHQAAHSSNSLPLRSQTAEQFALPSHQAAHLSNSLQLRRQNNKNLKSEPFAFHLSEIPHQASHTSNSSSRQN